MKKHAPPPQQPRLNMIPGVTTSAAKRTDKIARDPNKRFVIPEDDIDRTAKPAEVSRSGLASRFADPPPANPDLADRPPSYPSKPIAPPLESRQVAQRVPPGHQRVGLPSMFIPYSFKELIVRPLNVGELAMIASANEQDDFTGLLDALANCLNEDIRDLTGPDFRALLYWLRLNSYPRSPYTVKWTSRYGNKNEMRIRDTTLEIKKLETLTSEQYQTFRSKGIRFPTVRDAERQKHYQADPRMRFLYDRAQYLHVDEPDPETGWIGARISLLEKSPIEVLEDIREFVALTGNYGVTESIKTHDAAFDSVKGEAYLRTTAQDIMDAVNSVKDTAPSDFLIARAERAQELLEEAEAIAQHIQGQAGVPVEQQKPYETREETIVLSISMMDFFPQV